jgi:hypothetical protein
MSDIVPTSDSETRLATPMGTGVPDLVRVRKGLRAVYAGTLLLVLTIVASGAAVLVVMRTDPIYVSENGKDKVFATADLENWVALNSGDAGPTLAVFRVHRLGTLGLITSACSIFYGLFRCFQASWGLRRRIWIMAAALCFGVGVVLPLLTPTVAQVVLERGMQQRMQAMELESAVYSRTTQIARALLVAAYVFGLAALGFFALWLMEFAASQRRWGLMAAVAALYLFTAAILSAIPVVAYLHGLAVQSNYRISHIHAANAITRGTIISFVAWSAFALLFLGVSFVLLRRLSTHLPPASSR